MLNAYYYHYEVKINDWKYQGIGHSGWNFFDTELPKEQVLFETSSFEELYDKVMNVGIDGMYCDKTFSTLKDCVRCRIDFDSFTLTKKNFENISLKIVYRSFNPTIKDIINNCNAKLAIQYFLERGINLNLNMGS